MYFHVTGKCTVENPGKISSLKLLINSSCDGTAERRWVETYCFFFDFLDCVVLLCTVSVETGWMNVTMDLIRR